MVYLIYHIVTILHRTLKRNSSEKPLERVRGIFKTVDLVDTRYHVFIACQRLTDVDQFFMRDVCGADGNIYVRRAVGSHSPGRTYDFLTVQTRVFTYGDNRLTNYIIRFHAYQKISKPKRTNTRGIISNFFSLSLSLSLFFCFQWDIFWKNNRLSSLQVSMREDCLLETFFHRYRIWRKRRWVEKLFEEERHTHTLIVDFSLVVCHTRGLFIRLCSFPDWNAFVSACVNSWSLTTFDRSA